jgi:tetratricopeptide (TPR) repeat protein
VKKAISLDDENPDFWFTLGNVHTHLGESKEAIRAYTRTIKLDPYDDEAWINLAHLEFELGGADKAIRALKESYSHTFDIGTVNYHLAAYYYLKGNYEQSLKFFEKGLKLDYSEYKGVINISPRLPEDPAFIALLEKYKTVRP